MSSTVVFQSVNGRVIENRIAKTGILDGFVQYRAEPLNKGPVPPANFPSYVEAVEYLNS